MKKKLLVAALFAVAGSSVMAQSAFQGFYGQIATGYESNTVSNLSGSETGGPIGGPVNYTDSYSASSQTFGGAPIVLGLGYNFSVAPKWLIGVGVDCLCS